ncbi:MAG: hypothetical protein KF819_08995 [Labilithrix sp.]|nr:hypothetical protein [Labilithrix sp.]
MGSDANVFLLGTGVVGSALLAILQNAKPRGVTLAGVANRRGAALARGASLPEAEAKSITALPRTSHHRETVDDELLDALAARRNAVLVDATAADGLESLYVRALARGIHVVTANKKPLVVPWEVRQRLFDPSLRKLGAKLRYEATVGAGLPVIETLKDLVRTGDRVERIDCVLSGTLGFVANEIHAGTKLSTAIAIAKDRGYTEPDPREDLGGADVARKAVILARELEGASCAVEIGDVDLAPFVPPGVSLESLDAEVAARAERHRARAEKLVYLARIEVKLDRVVASAGPVVVSADHPAATLTGSSALVAFTTARYDPEPLVVRGSGAGGAVTAAAVLADVLKVTGLA